jgi:hypothetical protein
MGKTIFFVAVVVLFFLACNGTNQTAPSTPTVAVDTLQKQKFFPVTTYIKGQIEDIRKNGPTPLYKNIVNDKVQDSAWVKTADLDSVFAEFTTPNIDTANLITAYKLNSFNDRSTDATTLLHELVNKTIDTTKLTLTTWTVYINEKTGTVKNVFMVKTQGHKMLQLNWYNSQKCTMRLLLTQPNGSFSIAKEVHIVWNNTVPTE